MNLDPANENMHAAHIACNWGQNVIMRSGRLFQEGLVGPATENEQSPNLIDDNLF